MPISVTRAGKLIIGDDGFVTATLRSLELEDSVDLENKERSQLKWGFEVPTTKGTSDKYLWTGLNVNHEKNYYPVDADGVVSKEAQYNKLTQILLSLGMITETQLHSEEAVELDLEALIGRNFKFKPIRQKNNPNFSNIDISAIYFADESASSNQKLTVSTSKV